MSMEQPWSVGQREGSVAGASMRWPTGRGVPSTIDVMERPTIRQLEYVVAVADHRHFGRAAAAVGVTQPGLSSQIQDVERRLGVELFERANRAVHLTAAGELAAERARSILLSLDDLARQLEANTDAVVGPLRVGAIPTMAPYLLPPLVSEVRDRWPTAELSIVEYQSEQLIDAIESGSLDIGLLALPYDTRRLATVAVVDEPFVLALPQGHELADEPAVDPEALRSLSVLLLPEGHCLRDHARSVCEIAGKVAQSEVAGASLSTLTQMVAAGIGVTLLPAGAIAVEARDGSAVVTVPFSRNIPDRTIALAWRASDPRRGHFADLAARLAALVSFV